ncbi:DUF397 domain-containing protein [Actinomadura fibrosa]|uniref:DUF397 domain-containing protein n=1 Tax=Actinomadura fibrosa TaxID=111802 RepID=A0ABW2XES6_9ACTN|nr:DUF397 domain-containing protein [Actinomadura fibrosa]
MSKAGWSRAVWRRSARSNGKGNCVEVASAASVIGVRDSKDIGGPVLAFSAAEWRAFIDGVKAVGR